MSSALVPVRAAERPDQLRIGDVADVEDLDAAAVAGIAPGAHVRKVPVHPDVGVRLAQSEVVVTEHAEVLRARNVTRPAARASAAVPGVELRLRELVAGRLRSQRSRRACQKYATKGGQYPLQEHGSPSFLPQVTERAIKLLPAPELQGDGLRAQRPAPAKAREWREWAIRAWARRALPVSRARVARRRPARWGRPPGRDRARRALRAGRPPRRAARGMRARRAVRAAERRPPLRRADRRAARALGRRRPRRDRADRGGPRRRALRVPPRLPRQRARPGLHLRALGAAPERGRGPGRLRARRRRPRPPRASWRSSTGSSTPSTTGTTSTRATGR